MKIIFDFDYTLFDTKKFIQDLADIFNVTEENFLFFCRREFKAKDINYHLDKHLALLTKKGKLIKGQEEQIREEFAHLQNKLDEYLFFDVKNILQTLRNRGHKLYLMTCGDPAWQKIKVAKTGIAKYFMEIIYAERDKNQNDFLIGLKKNKGKILVINDNLDEGIKMQKTLGEIGELYVIRGPYSDKQTRHEGIKQPEIYDNLYGLFATTLKKYYPGKKVNINQLKNKGLKIK